MNKKKQTPWLSVWRYPEKTINRLVSAKQFQNQGLLTALIGLSFTLSVYTLIDDIEGLNRLPFLPIITALILGLVGSVLYIHFGAVLLTRISSMFKGSSKPEQVRIAIAWSSVPLIVAILFWPMTPLIIFRLIGHFNETLIVSSLAISMIFVVISRILFIYSFGILSRMMSAINHFSIWKGFLSTSIGILFLSLIPFAIYLIFTRFYSM